MAQCIVKPVEEAVHFLRAGWVGVGGGVSVCGRGEEKETVHRCRAGGGWPRGACGQWSGPDSSLVKEARQNHHHQWVHATWTAARPVPPSRGATPALVVATRGAERRATACHHSAGPPVVTRLETRPALLSEVATVDYVAAWVPLLGAPSLAGSSAETIDGSALSFLLQRALTRRGSRRKRRLMSWRR